MSPARQPAAVARNAAPVALPTRVGQGTAIEQSRAGMQELAMVQVAQSCPRDVAAAVAEMRQACSQLGLAEKAFYQFPRGGQSVSGPSIQLAHALASIWGNLAYGIAELRRDDEYGQSEMRAFCWDKQKNVTAETLFIVPHMRDKKGGPERLVDLRDIYENNANNGARRVREMIFARLPVWFRDEAVGICRETLRRGGSEKRLDERIVDMVGAFRTKGVTSAQLEGKTGRKQAEWNADDVADLGIVFRSIDRREITVDDAFPSERVTVDELVGQPATARQAPADASSGAPVDEEWIDERDPAEIAGGTQ